MRWAVAAAFLFCATWVGTAQAQLHPSRNTTFTSPDGTFRFDHLDALVQCQRDSNQSDRWKPDDSCEAFTPVCSDVSCNSEGTLVCMAYPAGGMKEGTNFQAAAISVNELKGANTETKCRMVTEPPPHSTFHTETINGVNFGVTEIDGVATGNLIHGYVYRNFHKGKCYELDIRIASSNIGNYDPGTMKIFDSEKVQRALKGALVSFKFLR